MENRVEKMISILFDKNVDEGGRHDVTMDLASCDDPKVLRALLKVVEDPEEIEVIVESGIESMAEILNRNDKRGSNFINQLDKRLLKKILLTIKHYNLKIYQSYGLQNIEANLTDSDLD